MHDSVYLKVLDKLLGRQKTLDHSNGKTYPFGLSKTTPFIFGTRKNSQRKDARDEANSQVVNSSFGCSLGCAKKR
jgi:hypothetical protein